MNKVFINEKPLSLFSGNEHMDAAFDLFIVYSNSKELRKQIQRFESDPQIKNMAVLFESESQKEKAFVSLYKIIEAAGGIVKNKENKILFIFRQGKWDLPKGKIEKGENEKEAALREVEEECGIKELQLGDKFTRTYHTYVLKEENILKISHWYKMNYSGASKKLVPQTEESITDARWMNKTEIMEAMQNTFPSIREVMELYFKTMK